MKREAPKPPRVHCHACAGKGWSRNAHGFPVECGVCRPAKAVELKRAAAAAAVAAAFTLTGCASAPDRYASTDCADWTAGVRHGVLCKFSDFHR